MSLRYLLDTNVVSSPISKRPSREILEHLETDGHECAIAAPVWNELNYGCYRMPRGKRRAALETYLHDFSCTTTLPRVGTGSSEHVSKVSANRHHTLGQIAAIAYVNELIVVTVNAKDFTRFKDIDVANRAKRGS